MSEAFEEMNEFKLSQNETDGKLIHIKTESNSIQHLLSKSIQKINNKSRYQNNPTYNQRL